MDAQADASVMLPSMTIQPLHGVQGRAQKLKVSRQHPPASSKPTSDAQECERTYELPKYAMGWIDAPPHRNIAVNQLAVPSLIRSALDPCMG